MPLERWSPTPRQGISAQRVMLASCVPDDGVAYLAAAAGDSPFAPGEPLEPGTPLAHPIPAWFHPTTGDEPAHLLNSDVPIVGETPDVLVVDKPHGLPSTPNGRLMRATAQTLLRMTREEPDLVAAHRLDRLTGGLLLFSRRQPTRGFLQTQFQRHEVSKCYRARTEVDVDTVLGSRTDVGAAVASGKRTRVTLPMRKEKGNPHVGVHPNGKMTETWVTRVGDREFALEPRTGHTHQLRVLMNHLGMPIAGDDTYPHVRDADLWDADAKKLQLRAVRLELKLPDGQLGSWEI